MPVSSLMARSAALRLSWVAARSIIADHSPALEPNSRLISAMSTPASSATALSDVPS